MSAALLLVAVAAEAIAFERAIEVPGPGPVAVLLDAPVYESARLDLADVRVIDDEGREVPALLRRYVPEQRSEPWQPPLLNRSDVPGESTRATLDLGGRQPKSALQLELSGALPAGVPEELRDGLFRLRQQGVQAGVQFTPTFIVNGTVYPGSYSIEEFAEIIEPLVADN